MTFIVSNYVTTYVRPVAERQQQQGVGLLGAERESDVSRLVEVPGRHLQVAVALEANHERRLKEITSRPSCHGRGKGVVEAATTVTLQQFPQT